VVLGSDGLFEFLTNDEIIQIVTPFYSSNEVDRACDELLRAAVNSWTKNSSVIDDITILLFFLNY
jgi:serine/threonine protein phosphatase PrpC